MSTPQPKALDQLLQSISEHHAQDTADARQAYVDLVALLAPPRTRPVPEGAKHAAVKETNGPEPAPEQVLAVLKAVDKTPEALRRDVRAYVDVREKADLVVAIPRHDKERKRRWAKLEEAREEFKRVQAEWKAKLQALKDADREAYSAASRGREAREALRRLQHLEAEHYATRLLPYQKEDTERAAEANAKRWDIERRSDALGCLARVFFPPPPEAKSNATRHEGYECWIGPRSLGQQ